MTARISTSIPQSLPALLRQLRRQQGLTQAALAERVGCATITLRKIEAGTLRATPPIAARLATVLALDGADRERFLAVASGTPLLPTPLLPTPPTPLFGRDEAVAEVSELLRQGARLITLTGAPGVGKTRLGLAVATTMQPHVRDGVWFVPLAALDDPAAAIPAIAHAIAAPPATIPLTAWLAEYLRDRVLLLMLDTFEHLAPASSELALLLAQAPGLQLLVTSRAVLKLTAEQVYTVPPLALPSTNITEVTTATASAAVQLFVARAVAANPRFALTAGTSSAVVAICRMLEGNPLAIELAAARARRFTPATLLARLSDRLNTLANGPVDLPANQQSLRATLDWSYALLDPNAQQVLRVVSVCPGGFDLEMLAALGLQEEPFDTLVDHNLAVLDPHAGVATRYYLPESVRAYGLERLQQKGELVEAQLRQARYLVDLAGLAAAELDGEHGALWLEHLELEYTNLKAALHFCLDDTNHAGFRAGSDVEDLNPRSELGAKLASALWRFWQVRGYAREGRAWLEQAHAQSTVTRATQVQVLLGLGYLTGWLGDVDQAEVLLGEAVDKARALGDAALLRQGLLHQAALAAARGSISIADSYAGEARTQGEAWHDWDTIGWAEHIHAQVALAQGGGTAFEGHLHNAQRAFNRRGNMRGIAQARLLRGLSALARGEQQRAAAAFAASAAAGEQAGDLDTVARARHMAGEAWLAYGNFSQALLAFEQALAYYRACDDHWSLAACLLQLGMAVELEERLDAAEHWYAAAKTLAERRDLSAILPWASYGLARVAVARDDVGTSELAHEAGVLLNASQQRREAASARGMVYLNTTIAATTRLSELNRLLAEAHTTGDTAGIAELLRMRGQVLEQLGREREAVRDYRVGLHQTRLLNDHARVPLYLVRLANMSMARGNVGRAQWFHALSAQIATQVGRGHVLRLALPNERADLRTSIFAQDDPHDDR